MRIQSLRTPAAFAAALTLLASLALPPAAAATTLDDLSWMVGHWKGAAMGGNLEERWVPAAGGTLTALVRSSSATDTMMIEVIVITSGADGLELRLRQFEKDLTPRTPDPVRFKLESAGERTVTFANLDESAPLAKLTYSRPSEDAFQVKVGLRQGNEMVIDLAATN
jgi:hypothetical protein